LAVDNGGGRRFESAVGHQSSRNRTSAKKITVGVSCVTSHARPEVRREQGGKRLSQGRAGDARTVRLTVEEELNEEALVEHAADAGAAEPVDLINTLKQFESAFECALDVLVDHLGGSENAFGLVEVALDAILLFAGEVIGDGAGDNPSRQATALLAEFFDAFTGTAGSVALSDPARS
jgi:hypothetical protein